MVALRLHAGMVESDAGDFPVKFDSTTAHVYRSERASTALRRQMASELSRLGYLTRFHTESAPPVPANADLTNPACISALSDEQILAQLQQTYAVRLTPTQGVIFVYLLRHQGEVCPRASVWSRVWGRSYEPLNKTMDVHLCRMRRALRDTPFKLEARRHKGWLLTVQADPRTDGYVRVTRPDVTSSTAEANTAAANTLDEKTDTR